MTPSGENPVDWRGEPREPTARLEAAKALPAMQQNFTRAAATGDAGTSWSLARSHSQSRTSGCWLRALISAAIT